MAGDFGRVAILGLGLIGGAIGRALKSRGLAYVTGLVRREQALEAALELGAADVATLDVREAVQAADLVLLATGVEFIPEMAGQALPYAKKGAVLTDVGSTKVRLVACLEALVAEEGRGLRYVGSHPMAGSEKRGITHCAEVKLAGALCLLTPTAQSDPPAADALEVFWQELGMRTIRVDPLEHDLALAYCSHLPHFVSAGVVNAQRGRSLEFAATGFRSLARLAGGDPSLWAQIALHNHQPLATALRSLAGELNYVADLVETEDQEALESWLAEAKRKHDEKYREEET